MGNENGRMLTAEEIRQREIALMDGELKRKLNTKATKYNLKLVIKGDRNTGKTSLFNRLQGRPYTEEYTPTPEIQIAHINWNYKNTDDIVDVEVWDVVDISTKKKQPSQLQLGGSGGNVRTSTSSSTKSTTTEQDEEMEVESFYADVQQQQANVVATKKSGSFKFSSLDAQTVDVMKNAHAVIFMVNPHKRWTFQYAEKELQKVPDDVYVLLVTNFRDHGDWSKQLSMNEIEALCESRPSSMMRHIDASMLNAYGLRTVISFLNIPFLHMQRNVILQQLDRNQLEFESAVTEVTMLSQQQSYTEHTKRLDHIRLEKEKLQQKQQLDQQQQQVQQPQQPQQPKQPSPPLQGKSSPQISPQQPQQQSKTHISAPPAQPHPMQTPQQSTQTPPPSTTSSMGFFSRLGKSMGISKEEVKSTPTTPSSPSPPLPQQPQQQPVKKVPQKITSVDEFDPSGESAMDSFYDDDPKPQPKQSFIKSVFGGGSKNQPTSQNANVNLSEFDEDEDDHSTNPYVTKDEDIDEDQFYTSVKKQPTPSTSSSSTSTIAKKSTTAANITSNTVNSNKTKPQQLSLNDDDDDDDSDEDNPFVTKDEDYDDIPVAKKVTPTKPITTQTKSVTQQSSSSTPSSKLSSSPKPTNPTNTTTNTIKSPTLSSSPKTSSPTTLPKQSATITTSKVLSSPKPSFNNDSDDDDEEEGNNPFVIKDEDYDDIPVTKKVTPTKSITPQTNTKLSSSPKPTTTIPTKLSSSPKISNIIPPTKQPLTTSPKSLNNDTDDDDDEEEEGSNPFVARDNDYEDIPALPTTKISPKLSSSPKPTQTSPKPITQTTSATTAMSSSPKTNFVTTTSSSPKLSSSPKPTPPKSLATNATATKVINKNIKFNNDDDDDDHVGNSFVTKHQGIDSSDEGEEDGFNRFATSSTLSKKSTASSSTSFEKNNNNNSNQITTSADDFVPPPSNGEDLDDWFDD